MFKFLQKIRFYKCEYFIEMTSKCEHRNLFCVGCGLYAPTGHRQNVSTKLEEKFEEYFAQPLEKQWYIPEVMCVTCYSALMHGVRVK